MADVVNKAALGDSSKFSIQPENMSIEKRKMLESQQHDNIYDGGVRDIDHDDETK